MRAIQITAFGGPEVLTPADLPDPVPGPGEVLIRVSAAGVNFADGLRAANTYVAPQELPFVPGSEVVGTDADGRRVVALLPEGGFAALVAAPSAQVFELVEGVADDQALALLVQGSTAWHLLRTSTAMAPGESVVVHSAAGGVGSLAVQLARRWGAGRVIATASTPEKRALALELGADVAVDLGGLDAAGVEAALRAANGGRGVDVVLESVGGPVFDGSFSALAPFGRLVVFGAASGVPGTPVPPVELLRGSRTVVGFWLSEIFGRRHGLGPALEELFSLTATGLLRPVIGGHHPLEDAGRALEDLAARRTTGKLVLDVG